MESKMDLRVANGKYRLLKRCGAGAFGTIFYGKYKFITILNLIKTGKNVKLGDEVAIKLVSFLILSFYNSNF